MGVDSKHNFAPPTVFWGSSFALDVGYLSLVGSNIVLLMAAQQQAVILEFSEEKRSQLTSSLALFCGC